VAKPKDIKGFASSISVIPPSFSISIISKNYFAKIAF
jgi:hypothetical protein